MGDREREHRAERVHRAEEGGLARQEDEDRDEPAEDDQRDPRRLELRVQVAEDGRQLPVAGHGVGDPRGPDHACVRGDEEDRRREQADVDLDRRKERSLVQSEVLDEPEHRVVREAVLRRRQSELGHAVVDG